MRTRPEPVATYRLQLGPTFRFDAAAEIVGYLAELGVSHLYLSPIFEARPGSTHGYDQTDPSRIRAELGGEEGFERLVRRAGVEGLGIVLDIVPNHMAAHHDNPLWFGLLRHGRDSEPDRFFDVDWGAAGGKIVLPVLGGRVAEVIAKGELSIEDEAARGRCVRYFDRLFPLRPDVEATFDARDGGAFEAVLARQHYELAYWKEGLGRINYRRFFDVADLAGVRVEDPIVFERTHAKLFELVGRGWIDGVRVDHVDGLADPLAYLQRLRAGLDRAAGGRPRVWIVVEKILARDERLPPGWPVDGTTGYEFLAATTTLMTDGEGVASLRRHAVDRLGGFADFHELAGACKEEIATSILASELARLCGLAEACLRDAGVEADAGDLRLALVRLSACLGVYRTYADDAGMSPADQARVREAVRRTAEGDVPLRGSPLLAALVDALTLSGAFGMGRLRAASLRFVRAWQQFTGPLAAKGVEDTALYRDPACPALCEVGVEPTPADGRAMLERIVAQRDDRGRAAGSESPTGPESIVFSPAETQPGAAGPRTDGGALSLNTTDTHDAKRSEEVRARLAVLTRFPQAWTALLDDVLPQLEAALSGRTATSPRRADLSGILHAALALWPDQGECDAATRGRLKAYVTKAVREAKQFTSWTDPRVDYESACKRAVDVLFESDRLTEARARIEELARRTRPLAARLSIGAVMLKTFLPGLPDWYQGAEARVVSLVDPDNRRPVDLAARGRWLQSMRSSWRADPVSAAAAFLRNPDTDTARLFVTWRALTVRRYLLSRSGRIGLQSLSVTRSNWSWAVSSGPRLCRLRIMLEHDRGEVGKRVRGDEESVDQLTGLRSNARDSWASIVVVGQSALL